MNGEEMDGGVSLDDMEKALVCLLMTSMEAPVHTIPSLWCLIWMEMVKQK